MQKIIRRYTDLPGKADLVIKSLCALISEQPSKIDWSGFGQEEWKLFEKMAVDEGVAPMAYYVLRTNPENYHLVSFDTSTYQALKEQEAINAVRNAILFKNLFVILHKFQMEEISVVLLKGVDLAQSIYPEPGLRRMTDIDLLVSESQLKTALTLVNQLGYINYLPEAFPGLDRTISHHAHLRKLGNNPILLELHWSLVGTGAFQYVPSVDWFWENAESSLIWLEKNQTGAWDRIFTLNPVANLLFLSAHQMLQHGGEYLSLHWLMDLDRIVHLRHNDIDWDALAAQANSFGWGSALRDALNAAKLCFNSPIPENLWGLIGSKTSSYDSLVEAKSVQSPTRILSEWKRVRSLQLRGKIILILALIIPTPAYMRWRYHPRHVWSLPYYYLFRWMDIGIDALRTLSLKVGLLRDKS